MVVAVSKSRVDLYADFSRQLVNADPQRRVLLISWADTGVPVGHIPRSSRQTKTTVGGGLRFPNGVLDDTASDGGPPADGMLLITTSSDDTVSRVRAVEALSAVWLQATRDNMSAVPLSQTLEVGETRRVVQNDVLDDLAYAQVVLRVGWLPTGRRPPTPAETSTTSASASDGLLDP